MKLIFRCVVLAGLVALASCATTTTLVTTDDSKSGYVVVSLHEKIVEDDASLGFPSATTVTFRRVGGSDDATIANRAAESAAVGDFGDGKRERGQVFVLKVQAGTWRFDEWKLTYVGPWTTERFNDFPPLSFEVAPGTTTYIGAIQVSYSVGLSEYHLPRVEELSISLADQSAADLEAAHRKYPRLGIQSVTVNAISNSSNLAVAHGSPQQ